jgi:hypothetical protein
MCSLSYHVRFAINESGAGHTLCGCLAFQDGRVAPRVCSFRMHGLRGLQWGLKGAWGNNGGEMRLVPAVCLWILEGPRRAGEKVLGWARVQG